MIVEINNLLKSLNKIVFHSTADHLRMCVWPLAPVTLTLTLTRWPSYTNLI